MTWPGREGDSRPDARFRADQPDPEERPEATASAARCEPAFSPLRAFVLIPKLSSFLFELRRRKVLRVAVWYAIAAVGSIEGLRLLVEALSLPLFAWRVPAVMILLAFPLALVMGQVLEVSPEEPLTLAQRREDKHGWALAGLGLLVALVACLLLFF